MPTYREWENNELPYGFLITFRTYGTWLHGDDRGSVDRHNNIYGSPRIPGSRRRKAYHRSLMKSEPVSLDAKRRAAVHDAIVEVCRHRGWTLHAINVRTNHVHVVVSTTHRNHSIVINAFKAYATRKMREQGCWPSDHSPWVDKGSQRVLWNAKSLEGACEYVIHGQGADLDNFDEWLSKRPND